MTAQAQYQDLYNFGSSLDGTTPFSTPVTDGTWLYGSTYQDAVYGYDITPTVPFFEGGGVAGTLTPGA